MTENSVSRYLIHATHLSLSILIDNPRLLGEGTRRTALLFLSVIVVVIDLTHARARTPISIRSDTLEYSLEAATPLYFTHDTLLYLDTTHTSLQTPRGRALGFSTAFKGARS